MNTNIKVGTTRNNAKVISLMAQKGFMVSLIDATLNRAYYYVLGRKAEFNKAKCSATTAVNYGIAKDYA
jgi:hypothetical protein